MNQGFARADGRKGIRNTVAVAYLVECAHHVARRIVDKADDPDVHLIGFPGCYPNAYAAKVMEAVATHPNVGGLVIVSLGCENSDREYGCVAAAFWLRPSSPYRIGRRFDTRSGGPTYTAEATMCVGARPTSDVTAARNTLRIILSAGRSAIARSAGAFKLLT